MSSRYSDEYGIIGDIVQSHILQTIALLAMEPPVSLDGEDIRNEKVHDLPSQHKLQKTIYFDLDNKLLFRPRF